MRRGKAIENILQRCLARIEAGESIAACLRDYPEHADELAPLLEVVADLRGWEPPTLSAAARDAARTRAHAALSGQRARSARRWAWVWSGGMRLALGSALALLLLLGTLGISVAAAQSSLPGQALYGLKRQSEELRLQLARDAEQQAELRLQFAGRRLEEALVEVSDCTSATELLNDLAEEYDQAWQAIAQLDTAAQIRLRARFDEVVQAHRQALAHTRQRATSACARAELERAEHVNDDAAERIATATTTSTTTATPTATATPKPTPRPVVRRTPTPEPTLVPTDIPTQAPTDTPTNTPTDTPEPQRSNSDRPERATQPAPTDPPPTAAPTEVEPTAEPTSPPQQGEPYPFPFPTTDTPTPISTDTPADTPTPGDPNSVPITPTDEAVPTPDAGATPGGEPVATSEPNATPDEPPAQTSEPTTQPADETTPEPTVKEEGRRTVVPPTE
jgi:hypothetical protein